MTEHTERAATLPATVDATLELLEQQGYVAERRLATAAFLALVAGILLFLVLWLVPPLVADRDRQGENA